MPRNQTFELPGNNSGHIIIALNDQMPTPTPDREGFNQACVGVQGLWLALGERLSVNHLLALAAMFAEYMRILENTFDQDNKELRDEENQTLRFQFRDTLSDMRETAAARGFIGDAESSRTRCHGIIPSFESDASVRDVENFSSNM